MRLIDADKLKEHIDKLPALPDGNFAGSHSNLKALINMQPTIEERKTGKWIDYDGFGDYANCSECGYQMDVHAERGYFKFCPNCGAMMV